MHAHTNTQNTAKPESYAGRLNQTQDATNLTKIILKKTKVVHGIPSLLFTMEEREEFAKEEGLHQAIVIKLSNGAPNLEILRTLLPKFFGVKGNSLLGLLAQRQLLLRLDQYEDFVIALARSLNYFSCNDKEHQVRIFHGVLVSILMRKHQWRQFGFPYQACHQIYLLVIRYCP